MVRKSEQEIMKRGLNLRSSALRYFKKHSSSDEQVKWAVKCVPQPGVLWQGTVLQVVQTERPVA